MSSRLVFFRLNTSFPRAQLRRSLTDGTAALAPTSQRTLLGDLGHRPRPMTMVPCFPTPVTPAVTLRNA